MVLLVEDVLVHHRRRQAHGRRLGEHRDAGLQFHVGPCRARDGAQVAEANPLAVVSEAAVKPRCERGEEADHHDDARD